MNAISEMMNCDEKGKEREWHKQPLPKGGEVDMITGGPPCQGFSGMNRFNHRNNAKFKNSLVASFLSWVVNFRPRYGLMENVKNLVHNAKGTVLKYIVKTLVKIGYQVCGNHAAGCTVQHASVLQPHHCHRRRFRQGAARIPQTALHVSIELPIVQDRQ